MLYLYPELRGQKYQSSENALPFWAKVNHSVGGYKCTLKSTSKYDLIIVELM